MVDGVDETNINAGYLRPFRPREKLPHREA